MMWISEFPANHKTRGSADENALRTDDVYAVGRLRTRKLSYQSRTAVLTSKVLLKRRSPSSKFLAAQNRLKIATCKVPVYSGGK
jgi:hypothetical protein